MNFDPVEIIDYDEVYHDEFKNLNLEWLQGYHLCESHDLAVLNDPIATIISRGGHIWLARSGDSIIGSAALMKNTDREYELAKMAVSPTHRGRGISKQLIEACLVKAKELGASKISLFSNHQLVTALKLYEKYGFQYVEVKDSPFETADVRMELVL